MKRILGLVLSLSMILSLTSCGYKLVKVEDIPTASSGITATSEDSSSSVAPGSTMVDVPTQFDWKSIEKDHFGYPLFDTDDFPSDLTQKDIEKFYELYGDLDLVFFKNVFINHVEDGGCTVKSDSKKLTWSMDSDYSDYLNHEADFYGTPYDDGGVKNYININGYYGEIVSSGESFALNSQADFDALYGFMYGYDDYYEDDYDDYLTSFKYVNLADLKSNIAKFKNEMTDGEPVFVSGEIFNIGSDHANIISPTDEFLAYSFAECYFDDDPEGSNIFSFDSSYDGTIYVYGYYDASSTYESTLCMRNCYFTTTPLQ